MKKSKGPSHVDHSENAHGGDPSLASSGKWSKPVDKGGAEVAHGTGVSAVSQHEVFSATSPGRGRNQPLVSNRVDSAGNDPDLGRRTLDQRPHFGQGKSMPISQDNALTEMDEPNKRGPGPINDISGNEEPCVPYFPSSIEGAPSQPSQTLNNRGHSNDLVSRGATNLEQHSPRTWTNKRHTNINAHSSELQERNMKFQKPFRLHTRAGPSAKYPDARFDDTALGYVNQYGKTMDNWNKSMYASPDKSEFVTAENDLLNSPGAKRNKYQGG